MNTAKMAEGIMGKKRAYPGDTPAHEAGESKEVEKDEHDVGDFEGMSVDHASNGFTVHVRGKQKDGQATNSQSYVFGHDHPAVQHIHGILKHTKKK